MTEAPDEPDNQPAKKPRRWKRWVFGLLLLLGGILLWVSGPGARMAVKYVLDQQLEKQKLSGTYEIDGNLASGLSLTNVDLVGESKLAKVAISEASIEWSLGSLTKKHPEKIILDGVRVTFDPDAPPIEKEEEPEKEPAPLDETLNLLRGIFEPSEIRITDAQVTIKEVTEVTLESLLHEPNSQEYVITELNAADHLQRAVENPRSVIEWTQKGLSLDRLELLPDLELTEVVFHPEESVQAIAVAAGTRLQLDSDMKSAHRLELLSPDLQVKEVAEIYDPELEAAGIITNLEIDTSKGLVDIHGKNLKWKEQKLELLEVNAVAEDITKPFDRPIETKLKVIREGTTLAANGTITPTKELLDSTADLAFSLSDKRLPEIDGDLRYASRAVDLQATALEDLKLAAKYDVRENQYEADLRSDLSNAGVLHSILAGQLQFTAKATGDLNEATHQGTLDLGNLRLTKEGLPDARTEAQIAWDWPKKVEIESFKMTAPEGVLEGKLDWQDALLTIDTLTLTEGSTKLLTAKGKIPASLETKSAEDFLSSTEPIQLQIFSQPLTLRRLSSFAPIPENLRAVLQADLNLTGSLAAPQLNGFLTANDFRLDNQPDLPPADMSLRFRTENQKLILDAKATEPGGPLLNVEGNLPFLPKEWINKAPDAEKIPIDFRAYSPDLDLERVQPFVPAIKSVDGSLKIEVTAKGTLTNPDLNGEMTANIQRLRIADSPISDFRDSYLRATFDRDSVNIRSARFIAAGGTMELGGTIKLVDKDPVFDIRATGTHFLLTRNADYTFRGNPDLTLKGTMDQAAIRGTLAITESLIYKDVEILPFGVPRTTKVPEPKLPTFVPEPAPPSNATQKSSSFKDWTLEIAVTTKDPILVRGNLARGEIVGNVRVFGTIGDPKTSGTLQTRELSADLPFSDLKVDRGVITLRPDSLTNPSIDLRGTSTVGEYLVQIYVTGRVQNPELILTSNPPLPDNEIMLLLATGSASAQLEDRQVASQKALQYLLEGIRRRNAGKDKTVLQRLLKNSDQVQLSLGDTNQFSGRTFSSASLELSEQWDFTTQIDEEGQTRALLVFSVRFK